MALGSQRSMSTTSSFFTGTPGNQAQVTGLPPDGSSNDGGGGLQNRGANYFFGFLITFVVLLLVFVGCGIGSRRRFLARRQAMFAGNMEPWAVPNGTGGVGGMYGSPNVEYKPPVLYDPKYDLPLTGEEKWRDIKPITAILLRSNGQKSSHTNVIDHPEGVHSDQLPPLSFGSDFEAHPRIQPGYQSQSQPIVVNSADHLPTHSAIASNAADPTEIRPTIMEIFLPLGGIRPQRHKPSRVSEPPISRAMEPPEALQIAVMIIMPSPDRPQQPHPFPDKKSSMIPRPERSVLQMEEIGLNPLTYSSGFGAAETQDMISDVNVISSGQEENHEYLPEYQIGVTTLPWQVELRQVSPDSF